MWVHLLDKDGFVQFKLNHFYINWSFGVQCLIWCHNRTYVILSIKLLNLKPLWNKKWFLWKWSQRADHTARILKLLKHLWNPDFSATLLQPFSSLDFLPLINTLFLPMNQICAAIFPDFVLFRYFLGTFVETMKPRAPVSSRFLLLCTHTTSWQHVCEARWRFLGVRGSTVEGLQTPAELSHPLSPPCFLLPDELWLAGLIVCVQQTNVGSLTGLSKLRSPSSNKKKEKPMTYSFCDQWYPLRGLPTNQFTKVTKGLSEKRTSVSNTFQQVTINREICAIYIRKYKIQDIIYSFNEFYCVEMFWSIFFLGAHTIAHAAIVNNILPQCLLCVSRFVPIWLNSIVIGWHYMIQVYLIMWPQKQIMTSKTKKYIYFAKNRRINRLLSQ